jgi:hypothetical protein
MVDEVEVHRLEQKEPASSTPVHYISVKVTLTRENSNIYLK